MAKKYKFLVNFILSIYFILHHKIYCVNRIKLPFDIVKGIEVYSKVQQESNYAPIDQQAEETYLNKFISSVISVISQDNVTINNTLYTRDYIEDVVQIKTLSLALSFYRIKYNLLHSKISGGFSFALHPKNESFSMLHQLKNQNKIQKLVYAFAMVGGISGNIFLGGIPPELIEKKVPYEINIIHNVWGCKLKYAFFDEGINKNKKEKLIFHNTAPALFQSGVDFIYVPRAFMDFFIQNFINDLLHSGLCAFVPDPYGKSIECNKSEFFKKTYPTYFNIIIDNNLFQITLHSFFFQYANKVRIHFRLESNREDRWLLGADFITKYISVYDYEKEKVTFYIHNSNMIYDCSEVDCLEKKGQTNTVKVLLIVLSIGLFCYIFVYICIYISSYRKKLIN